MARKRLRCQKCRKFGHMKDACPTTTTGSSTVEPKSKKGYGTAADSVSSQLCVPDESARVEQLLLEAPAVNTVSSQPALADGSAPLQQSLLDATALLVDMESSQPSAVHTEVVEQESPEAPPAGMEHFAVLPVNSIPTCSIKTSIKRSTASTEIVPLQEPPSKYRCQEESDSSMTESISSTSSRGKKKKNCIKCSLCSSLGHLATDCPGKKKRKADLCSSSQNSCNLSANQEEVGNSVITETTPIIISPPSQIPPIVRRTRTMHRKITAVNTAQQATSSESQHHDQTDNNESLSSVNSTKAVKQGCRKKVSSRNCRICDEAGHIPLNCPTNSDSYQRRMNRQDEALRDLLSSIREDESNETTVPEISVVEESLIDDGDMTFSNSTQSPPPRKKKEAFKKKRVTHAMLREQYTAISNEDVGGESGCSESVEPTAGTSTNGSTGGTSCNKDVSGPPRAHNVVESTAGTSTGGQTTRGRSYTRRSYKVLKRKDKPSADHLGCHRCGGIGHFPWACPQYDDQLPLSSTSPDSSASSIEFTPPRMSSIHDNSRVGFRLSHKRSLSARTPPSSPPPACEESSPVSLSSRRKKRKVLKCRFCQKFGHQSRNSNECEQYTRSSFLDLGSSVADSCEEEFTVPGGRPGPLTRSRVLAMEADAPLETVTDLPDVDLALICNNCYNLGHVRADCQEPIVQEEEADDEGVTIVVQEPVDNIILNDGTTCESCHRTSTNTYDIPLYEISASFAKRKFGDSSNLTADSLVCMECHKYLQEGGADDKGYAWPSVIFTFMTKQTSDTEALDAIAFVELLPHWHRDTYNVTLAEMRPEVAAEWHRAPKFLDCTLELQEFQEKIKKYQLAQLKIALDGKSFPATKCPMGCNLFIDHDPIRHIPIFDYLAHICPSFNSFKSDASRFNGKRPDWPPEVDREFPEFVIGATILTHDTLGPCIVMCGKEHHDDGHKNVIHVPRNPFMGNKSHLKNDKVAPAVASPAYVKGGRSNTLNSSSPVVREEGNVTGTSAIKLQTRVRADDPETDFEVNSMGLPLKNREDLLQSLINSEVYPHRYTSILETYLKSADRVPEDVEAAAKATGTFISKEDNLTILASYKNRHVGDHINESKLNKKGIEYLEIVHPANSVGHLPFPLKINHCPPQDDHIRGFLLKIVIDALLHVRALHHFFIKELRKQPAGVNSLHHRLQKVLKEIARSKTPIGCVSLENDLIDKMMESPLVDNNTTLGKFVTHTIESLCKVHRHTRTRQEIPLEDIVYGKEGILVVDMSTRRIADIPKTLLDGKWNLHYAGRHGHGSQNRKNCIIESAFRWSPHYRWQKSSETGRASNSAELPECRFNFLIYVEDSAVSSMTDSQFINECGGQSKVKCQTHPSFFLAKEPKGSIVSCSKSLCNNKIKWRCSFKLGDKVNHCKVALCQKHAKKKFAKPEPVVFVRPGRNSDRLNPINEESDSDDEDVLDDEMVEILLDPDVELDLLDDFVDAYDLPSAEFPELPGSTRFTQPIYVQESSSTPLHGLLNNCMQLSSRIQINRKAPVSFQRIFQYIHSISPNQSFPFLTPEGLLFPQIFWCSEKGVVVGALPSVLFTDYERSTGSLASLEDHFQIRMRDDNCLASRTPGYVAYAFDATLNRTLQHNSTSIAMRKGLEHVNRVQLLPEDRESSLKFDEADSRKQVKELAAFVKHHPWTFFITLTCCDSTTMGVGPIRRALRKKYVNEDDFHLALQNYQNILGRAWQRTVSYFFDYLMHSKENIFGKVVHYWMRYEFQSSGAPGNRPHVHGGLVLEPNSLDIDVDLSRIDTTMNQVFNTRDRTDMKSLIQDGIIKTKEDFYVLKDHCKKLMSHDCNHAGSRCMKLVDKHGKKKCRVRKYKPCNKPYFVECHNLYSKETLERFEDLGFAYREYEEDTRHPYFQISNPLRPVEFLRAGHYNHKPDPGRHAVPTHGPTFSVFQSQVNLQKTDPTFSTQYLTKYAAGVEERREISVTSDPDSKDLRTETRDLINAKITGPRVANKAKLKREKAPDALAREIGLNEMYFWLLKKKYVECSTLFEHFSTQDLEHRSAVVKLQKGTSPKLVNDNGTLKPITMRAAFPAWRRFTPNQQLHIHQNALSKCHIDRTSSFSVRPPELVIISRITQYLKYFSSKTTKAFVVSEIYDQNPWIDGSCKIIRIRQIYLKQVKQLVDTWIQEGCTATACLELGILLGQLVLEIDNPEKSDVYKRFVDTEENTEVVVVPPQVDPRQFNKFLTHLAILYGRYVCEFDLFKGPSLLDAFEAARLIEDAKNPTREEAQRIVRMWVIEEFRFLPFGVKPRSLWFAHVQDGLYNFFETKNIEHLTMPLASLRAIQTQASEKLQKFEDERREALGTVLFHQDNIGNLPQDVQTVTSGLGFLYDPTLTRAPSQNLESFQEQTSAMAICKRNIDSLLTINTGQEKATMLVGSPGSGKTLILLRAAMYGLSKGLRIGVTALTSHRAIVMGGLHLHLMFALPVSTGTSGGNISITAEKCLLQLSSNPVKMAYLKRLDVLIFEEVGMVPGYMLQIIDLVMRRLKDTSRPYGGIVLLCSGDPKQLKPIEGKSVFLGNAIITSFDVVKLTQYVRAAADPDLRRVLEVMRKPALSQEEIEDFIFIFRHRCLPLFVPSWDQVGDDYHRVVGKKAAVAHAVTTYLNKKIADPNVDCYTEMSVDEFEKYPGQYDVAGKHITTALNYKVREHRQLILYKDQVMRMTFNNSQKPLPRFSQGQLVIIKETPLRNVGSDKLEMKVQLVPSGLRNVDAPLPEWPQFNLTQRHTIPVLIGDWMCKARRFQWPLDYFVCSTVHKVIGETCLKLATQIDSGEEMFSLWDRDQLLVLLSRVRNLDDLKFVGDPNETCKAMRELLSKTDPMDNHISEVIDACNVIADGRRIVNRNASSIPALVTNIPADNAGFVYMLVSVQDPSKYKIDEAEYLRPAVHTANCITVDPKNQHLRPWALAAYCTNLPGKLDDPNDMRLVRQLFRGHWITNIQHPRHSVDAMETIMSIFDTKSFPTVPLDFDKATLVKCCTLIRRTFN